LIYQNTKAEPGKQNKNQLKQDSFNRGELFSMMLKANPQLGANPKNWPAVLAQVLQNGQILVKDGDKYRLFKANEKGELMEQDGPDSDGKPLSEGARQEIRRVLGQRRTSERDFAQKQQAELDKGILAERAGQTAAAKEAKKISGDIESRFALLLQKVLEEHKKAGKALQEGEQAEFPQKTNWMGFFTNLKNSGNVEQKLSKSMDEILKLLFRGAFDKKSGGLQLVGDLTYLKEGKDFTEKFAQIAIADAEFAKLLQSLKPGEAIDLAKLKQILGEQLEFLRHKHQGEKQFAMASESESHVQFNAKSKTNTFSQARLEGKLLAQRKSPKAATLPEVETKSNPQVPQQGVFANVYELINIKRQFPQLSKTWVFLTYALIASILGVSLTWLITKII
ncbi:MAG: hypothetical protein KDK66_08525, partial [Deltaproteobacteria bacterium]|nr:hypothetical protein [Deltaproteobacteria bacterium]